ncbi:hypothetical protein MPH_07245 [Macrophomina phaseolina MS6]|uniref:HAUS augmin-like complex subunit 3 n=1 Tax=Macrophomina phaseolina (strain MS6) TaxID=1126212 RepID=K2RZH7_MACPH|nr:hypothetical protein MPH_07245 [Macrophomina phaseolina MS6]
MRDNDTLNHLLTVLRDRRVPLTRDDVQWAFESAKTQNDAVAWVNEYLGSNTLLSKEELELYETLCAQDESIKDRADLPDVLPYQDEDIRTAIEALESSTATIDQQTKALEVQMDALLELRTQNAEPSNAVRRKLDERKKKDAQEKSQLDFEVEGLSDAINERVSSSQKQAKAAASILSSTVNDRFTSDDRMLSALTKLSSKLELSDDDQLDTLEIEKWCSTLVSIRAASIRTRVDRIFQETLLKCSGSEQTGRPEEEALAEKEALKEELETLHTEISSVAQMGVEQDFRGPILQLLEQGQDHQKRLQTRWLDYVLASLEYMTTRLHHLTTHAADLSAYTAALSEIGTLVAATLPPPAAPRPSPYKQAAAARARAKSNAATPIALSAASQQLLRKVDIAVPPPASTSPHQALAQASLERQERLLAHFESNQRVAIDVFSFTPVG